ncbi:MAG: hypothetical protein ABI411_06730 [Tahibacter sp.]
MKKNLHYLLGLLLALVLLWELTVWGSVGDLPGAGAPIRRSISREAPLVMAFVVVGEVLDGAVPLLHRIGLDAAEAAFSPGFERISQDPDVATSLLFENTWNATHRFIKLGVWAVPVLLLLFLIAYARRPRQVRMMR